MKTENVIPNYYALRCPLAPVVSMFDSLMPNNHCVDVAETMRLMLADFFYADILATHCQNLQMFDRTLALNANMIPPYEDHQTMMEILGDIFWALADTITNTALCIVKDQNGVGVCRPHEALYTFDPQQMEIMVYIPAQAQYQIPGAVQLDGRAVLNATRQTWPTFLTNALNKG